MKKAFFTTIILLLCLTLAGCQIGPISIEISDDDHASTATEHTTVADNTTAITNVILTNKEGLTVHFIDVGQGDCSLIVQGDNTMLIDAGENSEGEKVVNYLKQHGIKKLDYVIGTHPHSDHIGGLDNVIKSFDIGTVIMPKVSHNTSTYEDVLRAVKNKGLSINGAKAGQKYTLGSATFEILSPVKDKYEDLNEYSVVARLDYGDTSFLFTGDMESYNENELLKNKADVSCNVLKVAHHGSSTSNTKNFLQAVNAQYGIIPVGKGNDYGHPHTKIYNRLLDMMKVYRTDKHGTIIITSDGENISVATEKGAK